MRLDSRRRRRHPSGRLADHLAPARPTLDDFEARPRAQRARPRLDDSEAPLGADGRGWNRTGPGARHAIRVPARRAARLLRQGDRTTPSPTRRARFFLEAPRPGAYRVSSTSSTGSRSPARWTRSGKGTSRQRAYPLAFTNDARGPTARFGAPEVQRGYRERGKLSPATGVTRKAIADGGAASRSAGAKGFRFPHGDGSPYGESNARRSVHRRLDGQGTAGYLVHDRCPTS